MNYVHFDVVPLGCNAVQDLYVDIYVSEEHIFSISTSFLDHFTLNANTRITPSAPNFLYLIT
jgi:hypothetical protein